MPQTMENPSLSTEGGEEDGERTFEELGLDPRLVRALNKKGIEKPTPIQRVAIPLVLEGKDIVARAKTGSGKTFAYLLPLLQKLFTETESKVKLAPSAFILVPTRELSQQVYNEVVTLIELCRVQLKVVQLTSSMPLSDLRAAMAGPPNIVVSTPACIPKSLSTGVLQPTSIANSLDILVLDEADLLLSYGYEDDIKALTAHTPRRCQCLLMSATTSADVEKLKKLMLHNPYILTLSEVGDGKDEIIPKNVQQFWETEEYELRVRAKIDPYQGKYKLNPPISCAARDKLLYMLSLLKLGLVQKKVLIFTNTIEMGFRLRLFLEKFGIKSAVLNAELPQNSRHHIIEEFNAGLFDYLIATDDNQTKEKQAANGENNTDKRKSRKHSKPKLDSEFGVVRGIDFKNVHTVINFEMPPDAKAYVHRIGRTGRAFSSGASISLVSSDEMEIFEEIKSFVGDDENADTTLILPFPLLTNNAVESLRYRAEDMSKSVTKIAIREARAQDLRNEILNSEKLKAHFEVNPKDLDLLKHDKILSKKLPAAHLRDVPEYLLDPTTQEASKIVKLAGAAMGKLSTSRSGLKKKFRKNKDPLKSFNSESSKKSGRRRTGREGQDGDVTNGQKKRRSA